MNINSTNTLVRSLVIDLDLYTDGDPEMRKELILLMVDNVRELQESLRQSFEQNDLEIFRKTCHKVKPTISMLNDKDLTESIDQIKTENQHVKEESLASFTILCAEIIALLEKEAE